MINLTFQHVIRRSYRPRTQCPGIAEAVAVINLTFQHIGNTTERNA